jgi:hypothetical protein
MTKKPIQIILFFVLCLIFTSCSVYEDVYFNEDGTVSYSLKYDASQMLAMAPEALSSNRHKSDMPSDSTFSIAEMIEKEKYSTHPLSAEERTALEAIKPLYVTIKSDSIQKELNISIAGDFENADAMNTAFVMLNKISKDKGDGSILKSNSRFDINYSSSSYSWDGKNMNRTIMEDDSSDKPAEDTKGYRELMMMFSGGKMITRYHFPKRVKSVNKENALFSQDGKTIVIEQDAATHLKPTPEEFDITIETE